MSSQALPSVTIITPTYNRAGYLAETIESVLGQGYPNLEYIILDDGSTDETSAVVEACRGRLMYLKHPNMGEARPVSKGWQLARGKYVGVVNSDDPILPGLIEQSVELLEGNKDLLVTYPDWRMIHQNSRAIKDVRAPEYEYRKMVRRQKCLVGPGAFLRRRALSLDAGRDPSYRFEGDFESWLRLGLHGLFRRMPMTLATHRVHSGSASAERGEAQASEDMRIVRELHARPGLPACVLRVRKETLSNAAYLAGRTFIATSQPRARQYFLESLKHDPTSYLRWRPARLRQPGPTSSPRVIASKATRISPGGPCLGFGRLPWDQMRFKGIAWLYTRRQRMSEWRQSC